VKSKAVKDNKSIPPLPDARREDVLRVLRDPRFNLTVKATEGNLPSDLLITIIGPKKSMVECVPKIVCRRAVNRIARTYGIQKAFFYDPLLLDDNLSSGKVH
jgi:hypothetical protein